MRGLGTIINIGTVIGGSLIGVLVGGRLAERVRTGVMATLGLLTIVNGLNQAQQTHNLVFPLVGLVLGTALGEAVSLEERFERFGDRLAVRMRSAHSTVGEAFVTSSLVFCVGPLTILGSLEDGLGRGYQLLLIKSGLDGFVALIFASTLGWGVALSAVTVGVYQGALTLAARFVDPLLTPCMLTELTSTGGVMVMAIGVRLLELRRIRVGSMLPALLITPIAVGLFAASPRYAAVVVEAHTLHDEVATLLGRVGQRFTSGRRDMVDALARLDRPVTVPELIESAPGVATSSAYRHMTVLEHAGVVHRIVLGGDEHARFELAEALTAHHHHHLICSRCGKVDDFTVPAKLERAVSAALDDVAATTGFKATAHRFDLIGLCAPCAGDA